MLDYMGLVVCEIEPTQYYKMKPREIVLRYRGAKHNRDMDYNRTLLVVNSLREGNITLKDLYDGNGKSKSGTFTSQAQDPVKEARRIQKELSDTNAGK